MSEEQSGGAQTQMPALGTLLVSLLVPAVACAAQGQPRYVCNESVIKPGDRIGVVVKLNAPSTKAGISPQKIGGWMVSRLSAAGFKAEYLVTEEETNASRFAGLLVVNYEERATKIGTKIVASLQVQQARGRLLWKRTVQAETSFILRIPGLVEPSDEVLRRDAIRNFKIRLDALQFPREF